MSNNVIGKCIERLGEASSAYYKRNLKDVLCIYNCHWMMQKAWTRQNVNYGLIGPYDLPGWGEVGKADAKTDEAGIVVGASDVLVLPTSVLGRSRTSL